MCSRSDSDGLGDVDDLITDGLVGIGVDGLAQSSTAGAVVTLVIPADRRSMRDRADHRVGLTARRQRRIERARYAAVSTRRASVAPMAQATSAGWNSSRTNRLASLSSPNALRWPVN
jgi:hypothetical protein